MRGDWRLARREMLAGVMAVAEGEKYFSLTKPLAQPLQSLFYSFFARRRESSSTRGSHRSGTRERSLSYERLKVEVKTETRNRSNSGGGRRRNRSTGRSSSSGRQKSTSRGRSSSQVKVEDLMMDKYGHIGEGGDAVKNGRRQESPGGERTGGSRADNSASGEARVTSSSKVKGRAASVGNEVGF